MAYYNILIGEGLTLGPQQSKEQRANGPFGFSSTEQLSWPPTVQETAIECHLHENRISSQAIQASCT